MTAFNSCSINDVGRGSSSTIRAEAGKVGSMVQDMSQLLDTVTTARLHREESLSSCVGVGRVDLRERKSVDGRVDMSSIMLAHN